MKVGNGHLIYISDNEYAALHKLTDIIKHAETLSKDIKRLNKLLKEEKESINLK